MLDQMFTHNKLDLSKYKSSKIPPVCPVIWIGLVLRPGFHECLVEVRTQYADTGKFFTELRITPTDGEEMFSIGRGDNDSNSFRNAITNMGFVMLNRADWRGKTITHDQLLKGLARWILRNEPSTYENGIAIYSNYL